MIKKESESKKPSVIKIFFKLAPYIVKAAPVLFFFNAVISVIHGVFWGVETMMQQRFFDAATLLSLGKTSFIAALISLSWLALSNILCQVLNGVANFIPSILIQKVLGNLTISINTKISKLSPIVFEDTKKLDDINKAEAGKNNAVGFVFIFILIFIFYVPYFLFMGWYLFSLKPILAVSIIIVFIPTAATQIIRTRVFAKLEDKSAPVRREYEYYESCMVSREYFKETRLLGGFNYFKNLYMNTLDTLQTLSFKATIKSNSFELSMRLVTVFGYFYILLMLFDSLMKQEISVGAFAAVFNSIGLLYGIMEEVVCRHLGSMAQNMGAIQNYLNFLELEERTGSISTPGWGDITVDNVSFSYPNSDKRAVISASFTFKKGETLAIVGENGSGKSTLIRLITGLYIPDEGNVLINGINTKELSTDSLFRGVTAVFQKYQRYQMTLSDNIVISNTKNSFSYNLDEVCELSGLNKDDVTFNKGYDTMLSREFDGIDLSGGQWQRVAIARGFYREHNTIIFDEPTAAIDPYEETKIYNRFANISRNKSAIIVTHRIGSVKLADRIIVLKNGEISQIGTHNELVSIEGEYSRLYRAQESWYKDTV